MNCLATMECKKEDTEMVEIFFRLFNEALANFLGEEGYKFNPTMLCMDKVGANLQGVRNVFSDAFMSQVVMSMALYEMGMEAIAIYRCQ